MESIQTKTQKWRGVCSPLACTPRAGPLIRVYLSKLDDEARLSAETIISHNGFLTTFALYCINDIGPYCGKSIDEILLLVDRPFVKRYKNELLYDRKVKKRSLATILPAIRRFYDWLVETNRIAENPFRPPPEIACWLQGQPKHKKRAKTKEKEKSKFSRISNKEHLDLIRRIRLELLREADGAPQPPAKPTQPPPTAIEKTPSVSEPEMRVEKPAAAHEVPAKPEAEPPKKVHRLQERKIIKPKTVKTVEQVLVEHPMGEQLRETVEKWLVYITRFTDTTQDGYRGIFRRLYMSLPINTQQITREHIENFLQNDDKVSNATKNRNLIVFKSFCHWMSDEYNLPNPTDKIKFLPKEPPKRIWLTDEQVERILSVCSQDEAKTINLLIHTGLRARELTSLQPHNFSPDLKSIKFVGKGRKERRVPLNGIARDCVASPNSNTPNLDFLSWLKGERTRLWRLCMQLSKRAGLDFTASPHSFRRYFACSLIKKDVSIYYVSKLLGHSTVSTTERYLRCRPEDLEGITDVLCQGSREGGE